MTKLRPLTFTLVSLLGTASAVHGQYIRYEAEEGTRVATVVSSSGTGYSGTGYVTGFDNRDVPIDSVEFQVDVPDGVYQMWIGYRSPFGQKGYDYQVDGEFGSGMFDQSNTFTTDFAGLFQLSGDINTFGIYEGWAFYDVDYFEFRPHVPPALLPVSTQLVDGQADANTRVLMNYLVSQYGHKTLSGQQHQSSQGLSFPVQSYLNKSGGIVPAIRGSDLMEYSPTRIQYGANPHDETEQSIAWAKQTGGIVTMAWHWNAPGNLVDDQCGQNCGEDDYPWWRGFYSNGTTFDLPGALADPNGENYKKIERDIDAIAVELRKFQDAGVPVIWRPLHEAQGGWFWWGAHGPEAFKELWKLTYERLTNHHELHNLIWEFTSSAAQGNHLDWYPGDDVVDMVGLDIYTNPTSSMSGEWTNILQHYNGRKMIALSETGTLPNPNVMDQWGIEWSYFSPWNGTFVEAMDPNALQATLGHEDVVTVDELPVLPWKTGGNFLSADFDFDGDVDGVDLAAWETAYAQSRGGDVDFNGVTDGLDFLELQRQFTGSNPFAAAAVVPEPSALALLFAAALSRGWQKRRCFR